MGRGSRYSSQNYQNNFQCNFHSFWLWICVHAYKTMQLRHCEKNHLKNFEEFYKKLFFNNSHNGRIYNACFLKFSHKHSSEWDSSCCLIGIQAVQNWFFVFRQSYREYSLLNLQSQSKYMNTVFVSHTCRNSYTYHFQFIVKINRNFLVFTYPREL